MLPSLLCANSTKSKNCLYLGLYSQTALMKKATLIFWWTSTNRKLKITLTISLTSNMPWKNYWTGILTWWKNKPSKTLIYAKTLTTLKHWYITHHLPKLKTEVENLLWWIFPSYFACIYKSCQKLTVPTCRIFWLWNEQFLILKYDMLKMRKWNTWANTGKDKLQ